MIDHDRLFKELLTTFFLEFLELFFPEVAQAIDPHSLVFLDKEVFTDVTAGDRHEADLVVRARLPGQDAFFIIHVEHQAQAQAGFGRRMHRYFSRLHDRHQAPVYPVVLFSYSSPQRAEPGEYRVEVADLVVLEFRYRTLQLNQLDWRAYLKQANPLASALMSRMRIADQDRPRVKLECLRLLASLRLDPGRMHLISGFVDTYLRLSREEEARFQAELDTLGAEGRETVMKIVTSWMEEGLERGRQEGVERGREIGARGVLKRVLEARFGTEGRELARRVDAMEFARLEAVESVLLTGTWEGVRAALNGEG